MSLVIALVCTSSLLVAMSFRTSSARVNPGPSHSPMCRSNAIVHISYSVAETHDVLLATISHTLLPSVSSLRALQRPPKATIALLCDNATFALLLDRNWTSLWDTVFVLPLPSLRGVEKLPHSNKIRAVQQVLGFWQCVLIIDQDTFVTDDADLSEVFSILENGYDLAATFDSDLRVNDTPLHMRMINTGVLAMRNSTPMRAVLSDWMDAFKPCDASSYASCMPGTDQWPFSQLVSRHKAVFWPLANHWNCRCGRRVQWELPLHVADGVVISGDTLADTAEPRVTAGLRKCLILHCYKP